MIARSRFDDDATFLPSHLNNLNADDAEHAASLTEISSQPNLLLNLICIISFSMGGAIAVHVSVKGIIPTLIGLAVIDVVEGWYGCVYSKILFTRPGISKV